MLKQNFKQNNKQEGLKITLPEYRSVIFENIPAELKALKIWACWKSVPNPGKDKPDKVPFSYQVNSITGLEEIKPASCNRPNEWMTFGDAVRLKKSNRAFKGFQVALLPVVPTDEEDRLIGVDIDKAFISDGSIKPEYKEWIAKFNTYFELSPGDNINGGVRGFCFGHFPTFGGKHQGDIEIYQNGKWLTITGQKLASSPATINTSQETIDAFRAQYFKTFNEIDDRDLLVSNKIFTDEELINLLKNHPVPGIKEAFNQLFYKGERNPAAHLHTEEDLELCNLMRYYTQSFEQIDRIFRQSALMRDKWDEIHFGNGDTYGEGTVKTSLNTRTKVYMVTVRAPLPELIDFETIDISLPRFEVNKDGIFSVSADKDGELQKVPISSNPCVIIAKGYNSDQGGKTFYKLLIKASPTTENTVWKSVGGLMSKIGVMGLMEYDLKFQESDYSKLTGYFSAFIQAYENDLPVEMIVSSSGWKSNYTQFVVGNRLVNTDGVFDLIQIDNTAVKIFGYEGTAEGWAKGVDDIMKYEPVRFKAYGALGCLLIKKSDSENYIFDQCCGTTRLKSFTNRLVASMVGHPKKQQLSSKSTALGVDKIAAACNDLPVFLDETSENVSFVEELIYRFGNANTRVKSNTSNGLEISENYSSGLFLTGEDSIITESSKGGHHARRIPETHGVPEDENGKPLFVNVDIKNKVLKAMNRNYGNIITLFIQELLPIIDNIDDLVAKNFKRLPDTGDDALKGRQKGYYAVMLTAGEILERVFKKLGMTAADPFRIVTSYFEENVMCGVTEPDYIKFLRFAYDLYVSDKSHFGATAGSAWVENDKIELNEKIGWIDIKDGITLVNFRQMSLKAHIIKSIGNQKDVANRYETVSALWPKMGISNGSSRTDPKTKRVEVIKTKQIRTTFDDRQWAIQIPLENFYKYLKLEDDTEEPLIDPVDDEPDRDDAVTSPEEFNTPTVSVANQSPSSSGGLNQVVIVTAGSHPDITVYDGGSSDLYKDLYKDLKGDLGNGIQ